MRHPSSPDYRLCMVVVQDARIAGNTENTENTQHNCGTRWRFTCPTPGVGRNSLPSLIAPQSSTSHGTSPCFIDDDDDDNDDHGDH